MKRLSWILLAFIPSPLSALNLRINARNIPVYTAPALNSPIMKMYSPDEIVEAHFRVGNFWEIALTPQLLGYIEYSKASPISKKKKPSQKKSFFTKDPLLNRSRSRIYASPSPEDKSDLNAILKTAPDFRVISSIEDELDIVFDMEKASTQEVKNLELGRNLAGRFVQYYGIYEDKALFRYINSLGAHLLKYTEPIKTPFIFIILDSDIVNIFSCPGSYILLTRGLLRSMKNESELALFMAHAMAHAVKNHLSDSLENINHNAIKKINQKFKDIYLENRDRVALKDSELSTNLISQYMTNSLTPKKALLEIIKASLFFLIEKGFSRELEYEADNWALSLAANANYDSTTYIPYLIHLESHKDILNVEMFTNTHPPLSERRTHIQETLNRIHASEMTTNSQATRFRKFTRKLQKKDVK